MNRFRHHAVARFFVCVLLAWTALDLLAPQLCEAEGLVSSSTGSGESSQPAHAPDDCFCCAVTVNSAMFAATFTFSEQVSVRAIGIPRLSAGNPRSLYHPPLAS